MTFSTGRPRKFPDSSVAPFSSCRHFFDGEMIAETNVRGSVRGVYTFEWGNEVTGEKLE